MSSIALQMAKQELDRLREDLHHVEQMIEAKEQQILEASKADDAAQMEKWRAELVDEKKDLRNKIVQVEAGLARSSGEVPCCCPMLTGAMALGHICSVSAGSCSLIPKLCHPMLRAFVAAVPGAGATGHAESLLGLAARSKALRRCF